jgi:outer membrane protein OmpA-like peptidoglycan-associated protein
MYKTLVDKPADLTVKAMMPEYIADCLPFALDVIKPGSTLTAPRDLLLDKLVINKTFTINNIYYDFDKYNIRADAKPELDKLVRIMNENKINVELGSHTDCRGSFKYNDKLAQNRAESAVKYIVGAGIDKNRIIAKGYGELQLTNKCSDGVGCTKAEHQANRRTEFKVVSLDQHITSTQQFKPELYIDGQELNSETLPPEFFKECK